MAKYSSGLVMAEGKKQFFAGTVLKNNEKLTDDSGFVPLDIRMKKLDIATAQRKLALAAFDYREYEELLDDDINFSQYDSLEDLQDKIEKYNNKKKSILTAKFAEYRALREREKNAAAKTPAETSAESTAKQTNSGE